MFKAIEPRYSKGEINRAGDRIRNADGDPDLADIEIVENWRASHLWVLNTFQSNLRGRARGQPITVAQRLKRRSTIFDKLTREPRMELARMQDVAGCRVIFPDQSSLFAFRKSLHASRMKHVLRNGPNDRYNYIERPKTSGYRGVHDVFKYKVSSREGVQWNGLLVEIQYRTIYQHAWATAVEVADLEGGSRIKFSEADDHHKRFFQLASELLARYFENQNSCLREIPNDLLIEEFVTLDDRIGLIRYFEQLRRADEHTPITQNSILIFRQDSLKLDDNALEIRTYTNMSSAVEAYNQLEREYGPTADIVMVRAADPANIRDSFRNYFSDVVDFVRFIDEACSSLH